MIVMYFGLAFAQLTNYLHDLTEKFFVPVILIYMYLIIFIGYTTQYKIMIYEKKSIFKFYIELSSKLANKSIYISIS